MAPSRTVPTMVKPKIRPSTISLGRTGLVTTVCSVRLRMSLGRLKRGKEQGQQQHQVAGCRQDHVQVEPAGMGAGRIEEPSGKQQHHHEHREGHHHAAAYRFLDGQPGKRPDPARREPEQVLDAGNQEPVEPDEGGARPALPA